MLTFLFTFTIFLGAFLLFLVQPMAAKAILPVLGGSASVWNACMLFFQAALLAGYAYAHGLTRLGWSRGLVAAHGVVVLLPLLALGRAIPSDSGSPSLDHPVLWLLLLLATTVGPFFVVLATTGPLIQRWFASTDNPSASDPYFLYAASNAGSFLALLAYPLALERLLSLKELSTVWSAGYILYAVLVLACGAAMVRRPGVAATADSARPPPVPVRTSLSWVFLAFVPSSLMLGVTQHFSIDIAPVPLLWVVPLALYLLSFVMAFARRQVIGMRAASILLALGVLAVAGTLLAEARWPMWPIVALHLAVLFIASFYAHRRLALSRPPASQLTRFYLVIAVGGALGGLFNALVAPVLFTSIAEYPVALCLACLLRLPDVSVPWRNPGGPRAAAAAWVGAALAPAAILAAAFALRAPAGLTDPRTMAVWIVAALVLCIPLMLRPRVLSAALALLLLVMSLRPDPIGTLLHAERTFFGVYRVHLDHNTDWFEFRHGTTLHGTQANHPYGRLQPTMYFHREGPIGDVMHARAGTLRRVGIVGLGAGTLAAYGQPGMDITFFELDPAVARIAGDRALFHYLEDTPAAVRTVLGDARLSLADEPDGTFDLLILDAFSSDAIPVHLLTTEALALYRRTLAPGGMLAFHVSNRYLDLRPILAAAARESGLIALSRADRALTAEQKRFGAAGSIWVAMAPSDRDLGDSAAYRNWVALVPDPSRRAWTDDFSNILDVFGSTPP
jgi:SAM-dependent methyltransferase